MNATVGKPKTLDQLCETVAGSTLVQPVGGCTKTALSAPLPGASVVKVLERKKIQAGNVVYIGNDVNDLQCFEISGWSVAVSDAYPEVLRAADFVLSRPGGHGAVRELCELILKHLSA